jgi:hypothetical protein
MTASPRLVDPRLVEAARAADIVALGERVGARLKRVTATEWKWAGPCPACGGTDRFSLNTERRIFNCRGFGGGDAIAMVRHALGLDFSRAIAFITGEERHVARRESSPTKPADSRQDRQKVVDQFWRRREPIVEATPPWVYLREVRGYLGPIPATLGYLPARGDFPPAMVAAYGLVSEPGPGVMAIADASVRAVHVTRLASNGRGKAGDEAKITIGSPLGSPIVLGPPNDLLGLAITEGIEDALSIFQSTGLGAWAGGAAGYMPALAPVVPDWIDHVTIVAHRDISGTKNATKFEAALNRREIGCAVAFLGVEPNAA